MKGAEGPAGTARNYWTLGGRKRGRRGVGVSPSYAAMTQFKQATESTSACWDQLVCLHLDGVRSRVKIQSHTPVPSDRVNETVPQSGLLMNLHLLNECWSMFSSSSSPPLSWWSVQDNKNSALA